MKKLLILLFLLICISQTKAQNIQDSALVNMNKTRLSNKDHFRIFIVKSMINVIDFDKLLKAKKGFAHIVSVSVVFNQKGEIDTSIISSKLNDNTGGYSSKIEFNSLAIANASQLFLQMAVIHEVAHAYSNYYIKADYYGFPINTAKYSTWAMNIVNFESVARSEINGGNFNDHSLFIENYVENFVKILKDINGSSYTDKQYQMAAIYDLNNPGKRPDNFLIQESTYTAFIKLS